MMMSKANDDGYSPSNRMIMEAREHLQAVRNQFWRERIRGQPSPEIRRELAVAGLQLFDVLWEHREEEVVKHDWQESNVGDFISLLNETVEMQQPTPGDSQNSRTESMPALMALSADRLLQMTKDLDQLAKELGFSAEISQSRPMYDAGKLNPEDYDEPVSDDIPRPQ